LMKLVGLLREMVSVVGAEPRESFSAGADESESRDLELAAASSRVNSALH